MSVWQEVRDLITERGSRALADRVVALTESERREVAERLPGFLKEMRDMAAQMAREGWTAGDDGLGEEEGARPDWEWAEIERDVRWQVGDALAAFAEPLRIAGAGTLSSPAAAVAWLTRREFNPRRRTTPHPADLVRVLAVRPADWQADVAFRLSQKIRTAGDRIAPLVLALLRASGCEPPKHDPLVVAWLSTQVVDDDPLLGPMLPRIFEAEGAGRALRDERLTPAPTPWLALFRRLLAAGRVSREELLDGCVGRFLRGGDAIDLRFFVRLHDLVDPTRQEAAARARDYLRLLPAAPGPVAELALAQVRRTGPHDAADVVEAIGALTFRAEAKPARAGLSWLDEEVRRAPAGAGELAPALVTAFAHTSYEVQRRAAKLAVEHATAFGARSALIADAVPMLPADLGAQVAAAFGGEVAAEEAPEPFTPVALPEPAEPGPFPAHPLNLGKSDHRGWVGCERWLAGFVRQAWSDREALRETVTPAFRDSSPYLYETERWVDPHAWIAALAKEIIAPGTDPGVPDPEPVDPWAGASFSVHVTAATAEELEDDQGEEPEDDSEPGRAFGYLPEHVRQEIFRQMAEIGVSAERVAAMRDGLPVPPTAPGEPEFRVGIGYTGYRPLFDEPEEPEEPDPAAEFRRRNRLPEPRYVSPPHTFLLHRLSELYLALREGTLPPVLLATPTVMTGHLDPDVLVDRLETCAAAGAEPLSADLQQALLRLPRGTRPDAAERATRIGSRAASAAAAWLAGGGLPDPEAGLKWGYVEDASEYLFDERAPRHVGQVRLVPVLRSEPTGHDLIDELLHAPSKWRGEGHGDAMSWWPAVLPSHREVVSVNYLPHLLYQWNQPGVHPQYLAALSEADGPLGDATALILAYFLAERHPEAVPLLLRMAASGDLPTEAVGHQVALLIRRSRFETRPALASLTEAAHRGGHRQVWEILRSMLPALLPAEGERPNVTHSEAVALAADVAAWVNARGEIPAVSAFAESGRATRFAGECARLRDQLHWPRSGRSHP
ncbi:hypothetical protein DQ384_33935 [Sphaerisporangium album]|uniref:DUF7824 domain-containing protein n=1 Tax=Sphaerisporangium album TaxID=509200 RepID=A0A367F0F9_9ACTN|nr:DUF6493 family protein [Sphaerisporangium album]RCG23372.1 hypothetical protein DQ384_33935 [Sphaerisporangium album]